MRVVIQRCSQSRVIVGDECVSQIEKGLMLLVCLEREDDESNIKKAADKISSLILEVPESNYVLDHLDEGSNGDKKER